MTTTTPEHRDNGIGPTERATDAARALAADIGAAFEQARLASGLTRSALARELGVSGVTLLELEHGHGNPTLARLARYAQAYGVDLDIVARPHRRPRRRRRGGTP